MTTLLLILGWLACGVISAGFMFAADQKKYPSIAKAESDHAKKWACIAILLGASGLLSVLFIYGFKHGWLWPWSAKAKREAGL